MALAGYTCGQNPVAISSLKRNARGEQEHVVVAAVDDTSPWVYLRMMKSTVEKRRIVIILVDFFYLYCLHGSARRRLMIFVV